MGFYFFQNGFFSEVLFEISFKKWTFKQKSWVETTWKFKSCNQGFSIPLHQLLVYIKMAHGFITKFFCFQMSFYLELFKLRLEICEF